MTIKDLCFRAQSTLKSQHGIAAKRSHLYEVLAALFGYESHAALHSEALYAQTTTNAPARPLSYATARERAKDCGYSAGSAEAVAEVLRALARADRLCAPSVRMVLEQLEDGDSDALEFDEEPVEDPWLDLDSPVLVEGLAAAAGRGDADAHLALALLHDDRDGEWDDDKAPGLDGSYWYEQMRSGRVLTGAELEWAQVYERAQARREAYIHHIQQAAEGGNAEAAVRLAELSPDERNFSGALKVAKAEQASRLADVAFSLGREVEALDLLRTAAARGDLEAIGGLARRLRDDEEAWTWVYVAELCGSNLRQAAAIHEDGSPYDDDVGGPMYVAVDFDRERLPPEQDARAKARAQAIFQAIPGNARSPLLRP